MWHIFAEPILPTIVDANEDHWRNRAFPDQTVCRFVDLPFHSGKRNRRLKKILAVVQIEHRVTALGIFALIVAGRKPDPKKAGVLEDSALKFVQSQVPSGCLHTDYSCRDGGYCRFRFLEFFHSGEIDS